jgi:serine/threonine protein kinase
MRIRSRSSKHLKAPESLRDSIYSTKTDVYAYAVIAFEIITRYLPFLIDMPYMLNSDYVSLKFIMNRKYYSKPFQHMLLSFINYV